MAPASPAALAFFCLSVHWATFSVFPFKVRMSVFQGLIHRMKFQCSLSQYALAERSLTAAHGRAAGALCGEKGGS